MNTPKPVGLGDPQPVGKQALFKTPKLEENKRKSKAKKAANIALETRVRMTLEITKPALSILQNLQLRHRLKTGKTLPKWRILSEAIEAYGKRHETTHQ